MILPSSYIGCLLLLVVTLLCWGAWANTFLATGKKWRFELYYFDFAIGVFIAAIILALTLGSLGWDGFSFIDDVRLAGKRQDLFGFGSGMIFNLGNMLLVAGIAVAGMSLAFPVAIGVALIIGTLWSVALGPAGSSVFRIGGCAALIVAITLLAVAWKAHAKAKLLENIQSGKTKSTKQIVGSKGVILSLIAGLFLGSFYPLLDLSRDSEIGLGPYSLGVVFAAGIVVSTFVFNLFFMNLPVVGKPVDLVEYFRAKMSAHGWGVLGGVVWYVGALASFIVARVQPTVSVGPGLTFGLTQGSMIVAFLCGLVIWKELSGTDTKISYHVVLVLLFLILGVGLLSAAPAFAGR